MNTTYRMTVHEIASTIQRLESFYVDKLVQIAGITVNIAYVLRPSFFCGFFCQLLWN